MTTLEQAIARMEELRRGVLAMPENVAYAEAIDAILAALPTPEERNSIEHYARYAADKAYTVHVAGYPKLAKPFLSHAVHLRNYLTRIGSGKD